MGVPELASFVRAGWRRARRMLARLASHGDKIVGILILATWLFEGQNYGDCAYGDARRRWHIYSFVHVNKSRAQKLVLTAHFSWFLRGHNTGG
jgi:hypothetical protein